MAVERRQVEQNPQTKLQLERTTVVTLHREKKNKHETKQTQTKQTCLKGVLRRGTRSPPGTSSLHFHRPRTEATPRPVTCLRGRGYAFLRFIWTVAHFLSSCHCCGVQGKWGGREGDGGEERDEKGGGGGGERQRQRRGQEGRKG